MKTVPLGEVADFINGVAFKPEDWHGSGVPIIRIQNLTDPSKPINLTNRQVADKYKVRRGDILVSWSATLGVFTWERTDEALVNQHIFRVLPHEAVIEHQYLKHLLKGALASMKQHLHGATMQHVNRGEFLATRIPLPPRDEQRRIAAILDQADAVRAKRRETLSRLHDLAEAIFLDLFNDDAADAVRFDSIGMNTRNGLSPAKEGTVVSDVLTLSAVTQGAFDPTAVKSSTFLSKPPAGMRVSGDDFLICRGNGNLNLVGAGVSPGRDYPDLTFPDTVIAASLNQEKVDRVFLEMAWRRPTIRKQVEAAARTTNGTYKINQQSLGAIKIVIPPLTQQQEFARRIRAIPHPDTSDLDELLASLQSRAFSGQL